MGAALKRQKKKNKLIAARISLDGSNGLNIKQEKQNHDSTDVKLKSRHKPSTVSRKSSHRGSEEVNLTSTHADAGSIPGLAQWVKDLALHELWCRS